jgi:hypothetical protein
MSFEWTLVLLLLAFIIGMGVGIRLARPIIHYH